MVANLRCNLSTCSAEMQDHLLNPSVHNHRSWQHIGKSLPKCAAGRGCGGWGEGGGEGGGGASTAAQRHKSTNPEVVVWLGKHWKASLTVLVAES